MDVKERLLQLWKDILELPEISSDNDFFLCGGNSLTAIELLIKIQRTFHVSLPLDTIYRYPTLRDQELMLREKAATIKAYHPLISPLREGGNLPPLFCIHPLGGWMDLYLKILSAIDSARPVFGIRGRGLEPGEKLPTTVEDTAQEQVDALRTVQKTGPYHLLGFSNGGIIAFEMACQLQEQRDDVAFLGLIDISAPAPEVRYIKTLTASVIPLGRFREILAGVEKHLKSHSDSRTYRVLSRTLRYAIHLFIYRSGAKSLPPEIMDTHFQANFGDRSLDRFPKEQRPNMINQLKASYNYLPQTFTGDLVLFSTGPDPILYPGDITRGWGSIITGKCEVIAVPGDHSNLFDEPQLCVLLEKIKDKLGAGRLACLTQSGIP